MVGLAVSGLALAASTAMAAAPAGTAKPGTPTTEPQPNWSGYMFYQKGGHIKGVVADWTVPAVKCPLPTQPGYPFGTPRVGVWAGLMGTISSWKAGTSWLPQIGTVSQCVEWPGTPRYYGQWQIFAGPNVTGKKGATEITSSGGKYVGSGPQEMDTTAYPVSPGDHMEAEVDYFGAFTTGEYKGDLAFEIDLWNDSRSWLEHLEVVTAETVKPDNIVYQGGAIVEDHNQYGGLANFGSVTVKFPGSVIGTNSSPLSSYQWEMVVYGQQLAKNSRLTAGQPPASFTVQFECNGCLAGTACPPPPHTCTKV
jgi:hypothetical protein